MLTQADTGTTVPQDQQKPRLLPTYPQHLLPLLTPCQLRAALAGQEYYLDHQHDTCIAQVQICAFIKRKIVQWQYDNPSTEGLLTFFYGWHQFHYKTLTDDI